MNERSVHDNNVYAYAVECERRRIVLYTEYRDGGVEEYTDVIFTSVVAHHFECVLPGNILFDIKEVEPEEIVGHSADVFTRQKNYGWPAIEYGDPQDLASILKQQGIRGFEIGSSYGLSGWVLATRMEVAERTARMEP
jgi:hypothetical protein